MSEVINGIVSAAPVLGPFGVVISLLLALLFNEKKKAKSAPDLAESLRPAIEKAVDELGMNYIKSKAGRDEAEKEQRVSAHSDEIKGIRSEVNDKMGKIEDRVRDTEREILQMKTEMKGVKAAICDIKKEIKSGNESLIDLMKEIWSIK